MARIHRSSGMASGCRPLQDTCQQRGTPSTLLTVAVSLLWKVGTASAMIAPVIALILASPCTPSPDADGLSALAPDAEEAPGSGIVLRIEVTTIWIPQVLLDLARRKAATLVDRSPEDLKTYLERYKREAAWYALTYRGHQVNGRFAESTQIRRLSEAADHLDELQAVMATAAGRPPRLDGRDFSRARVEVIPETLQAVDPREAITRLMAEPVAGDESSPAGGLNSTRRTD